MTSNRLLPQLLTVIAGCMLTIVSPSWAESPTLTAEQVEFFEAHIRPVLIEHCYACHNSSELAEGGLAVDDRKGLIEGGEGGTLIVPGKASSSRLIAILKHEIEGLEMPEDGPKLADSVIANFERWIAMGAPDPREAPPTERELSDATSWEATLRRRTQWWSFQPIIDPPVPGSEGHPIDRFIRRRLQERQLIASPPAAPQPLIRRLYLTLVGIPPTVDELQDWMHRYENTGHAQEVTEALIDHLLSSDHFGEKWARHWMDWIRYAESHGSEGDPAIDNAWLYRDYLIRALNADIPYDQLVREHLAGDLLESPRINEPLGINESVIGTAHWRMVFHGFAPTDALDEKVRFVDDQVNAFSKAFLGLTISCARCHDHKFDAISQRDYYGIFGVLASCRPGRTAIDLPDRQNHNSESLSELKPKILDAIANRWLETLSSLPERLLTGDLKTESPAPPQSLMHPISLLRQQAGNEFLETWRRFTESTNAAVESPGSDTAKDTTFMERWQFSDPASTTQWTLTGIGLRHQPTKAGAFAIAPTGDAILTGIYPAGIYSHLLSDKHAARLTSKDLSLKTESEIWLRVLGDGESSTRYVVQDYPRNGTVYPVAKLKPQWTWQRFDVSYWSGDDVHIEVVTSKDAPLLVQTPERSWFGVAEARLVKKGESAPDERPLYFLPLMEAARQTADPKSLQELALIYQTAVGDAVRAWRSGTATDAQAELLSACLEAGVLANSLHAFPRVATLVERYRDLEAEIPAATRIPSLEETSGRTQPLLVRGNHRTPGEIVPRRFLEIIDTEPYGSQQSGRRKLAEDLLRDDNPFTRRVIVNRLWHHLFGRGIFATPDNLGRMGEPPTHPEMLDWLACRLVDDGWSLKSLIRRIVSSQTWQQSSRPSVAALTSDPNNHYLSHANLRRLDAEAIRDSLLSASGTLDRRLFGPPVNGDANRRSIYIRVIRNDLDPFLRSFDFPEPFSATGRRDVTNVPAQSLTMLNDPLVTRWATSLASSLATTTKEKTNHQHLQDGRTASDTDQEKVETIYLTLFNRLPDEAEIGKAIAYLQATRDTYQQHNQRHASLSKEIETTRKAIDRIRQTARERVEAKPSATSGPPIPQPIALWDFEEDLRDSIGNCNGTAHGGAKVESGMLVVKSGSYVTTDAIKQSLTEKTLEAWVQLDDLNQRGGGVISLQSRDGSVFDAIVFGERDPQQWLAGSNSFKRTASFHGPAEREAIERPIHIAIVFHADGSITGYRDGAPYGRGYQSTGPTRFEQDSAIISFGLRHLPAGGNRLLSGRMERASLYDRALSDQEIIASFQAGGGGISETEWLAAMTPNEREQLSIATQRLTELRSEIQVMGSAHEPFEHAVWSEMTRAMMLLKELIYVP